jgi:hypothetical protein
MKDLGLNKGLKNLQALRHKLDRHIRHARARTNLTAQRAN